ncbi:MAG: FtsQ-type POTRA domain-containing protein [Firmicutes bacterium]|nr:FtsQ-type POTRA domain-containing protein [Bacillota bacterium]
MKKNSKVEQVDFIGAKPDKRIKKKSHARKSSNKINLDNTHKKDRKHSKSNDKSSRRTGIKVLKWTSIAVAIAACIILLLLSPIFNIRNINVTGNSHVAASEIIDVSGIEKNKNMFIINIGKAEKNIEENPYIFNASIHRNLDGTVNINIEERMPTYMIAADNKYIYIDTQGYIMETSDQKLNVPTLTGYKTSAENMLPGSRLDNEDLIKLNTCINIMNAAKGNNIADLITDIDISNINDYILTLAAKGVTVHLGDMTRINDKIFWIVTILGEINGAQGEIFLNSTRPYFSPK